MHDIGKIVKGGMWLYLSSIVNNVGGFIYWLLISRIAGSSILGLTSATVSLASLLIGVLSLGIGTGLRHFLGACLGRDDLTCFRHYFWTGTLFSLTLYGLVGGAMILAGALHISVSGFTPEMLALAGVIVVLGASLPIQSAVVSTLRTEVLMASAVAGTVAKIVVGAFLVAAGWGFAGAVIGYAFSPAATIALGLAYIMRVAGAPASPSRPYLLELLKGSVVSWVPSVLVVAGQWLGVLAVFGTTGASETGQYYAAFTISNFVLGVGVMIVSLLLPVLSGMRDGRKAAASRVLRLSLAVMVPAAAFIAAYPALPLSLLGEEYIVASPSLTILMLSSVPLAVYFTVNSLVYSYRRYADVMYLGLSQNVPRLVLYSLLVPLMGGVGAATSFTAGALAGMAHAAALASAIGFRVGWRGVLTVVVVPAALITPLALAGLPWFAGLAAALSSYLVYGKVGVIRRADVRELAHAFLGEKLAGRIYGRLWWLIDAVIPPD